MKTFILTFAAVLALTGAALAGDNRSGDLRDQPTYYGKFAVSEQVATTVASPLALPAAGSNFEHVTQTSDANQNGGH